MSAREGRRLEHVLVEPAGDGVVEVRMNRPEKRNAMNVQLWKEIGHVFEDVIPRDPRCRCVVLTGAGKIFSAGIDVTMFGSGGLGDAVGDGAELDGASRAFQIIREGRAWQRAWRAINSCSKPVIAAIHGGCWGAALEMVAFADIRLCTADCTFAAPEVSLGLAADIGGNQMLPKIIGNDSLVRELMLSGRPMAADEALRFGLVSRVCPDKDTLMKAAFELARTIAGKSPVAVLGVKTLLNFSREHSVDDSLKFALTWNASMLQSNEVAAAGAAFVTKTTANFGDTPLLLDSKL